MGNQGHSAAAHDKIRPMTRRSLLAVLGLLLAKPLSVLAAWNEQAFGAKTTADALKGIGAAAPSPSKDILIEAPQIA